jgi:hypothetical protein
MSRAKFFLTTVNKIQVYLESLDDGAPITAAYDTPFASISKPSTLTAHYSDGSSGSVPVVAWEEGAYVQDAPGLYDVYTDVTLPPGISNPFLIRGHVTIEVQEEIFVEIFTAPTGLNLYTVLEGVDDLMSIELIGGGASGGGVGTINRAPGSGGGAFSSHTAMGVVPGEIIPYYIAPLRAAAAIAGADVEGSDGFPSWFGPSIPEGSTHISGTGAPAGGTGADGNYYSDLATGNLYLKTAGVWGAPTAPWCRAAGGKKGTGISPGVGGLGGAVVDCIGNGNKYKGGDAIAAPASRSGAGGGAAGPTGAGNNATTSGSTNSVGGAGATATISGNGGNGSSGTPGAATVYGGGAAGARSTVVANVPGGNGQPGWGRLTFSGASVPPAEPGNSFIGLIAGQSNQITSNGAAPGAPYEGPLDANIWINSTVGFEPVQYGVNANPGGSLVEHGPILSLATELGALAPGEVDFVLKSQSGTSMRTGWNVTVNAIGRTSVSTLIQAIRFRKAQGKNVKMTIIDWRQGEADFGFTNVLNIDFGSNTIVVGTAPPTGADGANGDLFIDKTNNKAYGPKSAGSWNTTQYFFDIVPGSTILSGVIAPAGGVGVNGNYYYDEVAHLWYGPKAGGVWPAGRSIISFLVEESYFYWFKGWNDYLIDAIDDEGDVDRSEMQLVCALLDNYTSSANFKIEINAAQTRVCALFGGSARSTAGKSTFDGVHFDGPAQIARGLDEASVITSIP